MTLILHLPGNRLEILEILLLFTYLLKLSEYILHALVILSVGLKVYNITKNRLIVPPPAHVYETTLIIYV